MATLKPKRKPTRNPTPKKGAKKAPKKPVDWRVVFLAHLAKTGNVSAAAAEAGINRDTAYSARDPEGKDAAGRAEARVFAAHWKSAIATAVDALELEARRRAVDGVREPVGWYQGESGGHVRRYSDTLLIVLLKAHRPEIYRETIVQKHDGRVEVAHSIDSAIDKIYGDDPEEEVGND